MQDDLLYIQTSNMTLGQKKKGDGQDEKVCVPFNQENEGFPERSARQTFSLLLDWCHGASWEFKRVK